MHRAGLSVRSVGGFGSDGDSSGLLRLIDLGFGRREKDGVRGSNRMLEAGWNRNRSGYPFEAHHNLRHDFQAGNALTGWQVGGE